MKLSLTKEWFESRLPQEDGLEIGAGLLQPAVAGSPTPETDIAEKAEAAAGYDYGSVSSDFARRLERERNTLLADVKPLIEAATTLKAAKGRHNTGIAYGRFLEAVESFTVKHPA